MENLNDEKLMRMAKKRVKTKRYLKSQGLLFLLLFGLLTVIYFIFSIFTGERPFFWPLYAIMGMSIAFLVQVVIFLPDLFCKKSSTEDAIQKEYEKLKKNS